MANDDLGDDSAALGLIERFWDDGCVPLSEVDRVAADLGGGDDEAALITQIEDAGLEVRDDCSQASSPARAVPAERGRHLEVAREGLEEALGRQPTDEELAAEAGLTVDQVRQVHDAARVVTSLDVPVGEEGDITLGGLVPGGAAWRSRW